MIWWLLGCGNPLINDLPRLETINGLEEDEQLGWRLFVPEDAEVVELELEVSDAEGQDVQVWWPQAPPGLSFDPDGTTGTWALSSEVDLQVYYLTLILSDSADPPGISQFSITPVYR